jgi:Cu/Ag efflux pump CusA
MRAVLQGSVRFRLLVVAVAAALLFVGGSQLRKAPVEVLPDFTPTTVEVQTEALGLSAPEVEQLITVPIEQDLLNGVAFLKDIQSESVPGLSRILMIFQPGTSVFKARQVVAERLTQTAALPQVSKPPRMLQPLSSTNRVLLVGMTSRNRSLLQMGVLARWTIAPRLVGLPGVANVAVWGQEDRQLQVQVDPQRLRTKGVGLDEVIETSANALWVSPLTFVEASTPGTGGFVETGNQRLGIQHESPISTAADLAKVRVEGTRRDLVLGDVANVIENHQPLIGDAVVGGRPGLLLVVQRFPGTNLLTVTRTVERALHQMQPGLHGIEFDTSVYRPASYVETSIDNLRLALSIGFGLLAAVLAACFFRLRAALVALVVIPLSVVTAALVLWAFGSTMNAIVLAGLVAALLLVIDDAVVTVESVAGRLSRQADDAAEPRSKIVVDALAEAGRPLLYATLIVGLAVVPVFFLEQLSGAFFPHLAAAYLVALLSSLAVALTVTPALAALLLARAKPGNGASPLSSRLAEPYERSLTWFLARARLAYIALGGLLVLAAVSAPLLHQSLLPRFKESQLLIPWNGPPGTSLPEMNRITARASRELASIPGVRGVGGHVGRAVTGDQVVGANSGELWVNVDPHADYNQTVAAVERVVAGYPGLSHEVETYSGGQVQAALGGTSEDVVTRIYGENLQTLGAQAERVRRLMSGVDGISGAHVLAPPEQPTLEVRVDLAKADRYGIKPGDVRRAATTLLSGLVVGSLFEQEKVFDVVVWGTPQVRNSLTSVRRLLIETPEGGYVRLGQVANVRIAPSPEIIRREAVSRYVDVGANVSGRDRDAVVRDVQSRLRSLRFPIAYHAEVPAVERQPTWRLVSIAVAAVVGMFLLLQAFFVSWRLAALSLLALPIGAAGGLAAALIARDDLSFGSYIALFAAAAFAVRCGILLFARFRQLEEDEGEEFGAGLVLRGAGERLAPVATTAAAAFALVLPLLVLGSRPGLELIDPLAVVLVGGLVTTVPYALFVLPAVYLRFAAGTATAPVEEERLTAVLDGLAKDAAADAGAASGATLQ